MRYATREEMPVVWTVREQYSARLESCGEANSIRDVARICEALGVVKFGGEIVSWKIYKDGVEAGEITTGHISSPTTSTNFDCDLDSLPTSPPEDWRDFEVYPFDENNRPYNPNLIYATA